MLHSTATKKMDMLFLQVSIAPINEWVLTILNYLLAAIDLDGTLLGPDGTISKENVQAVRKLQQAGVQIMLASGRSHESIMQYHAQLSLSTPVVSCQGALVRHPVANETIFFKPLSADLANCILHEAERLKTTVVYFHEHGVLTNACAELKAFYEQVNGSAIGSLDIQLRTEHPFKILWSDKPERIANFVENLPTNITENCYIVQSEPKQLEFMAIDVNKAVGIKAVTEFFGIRQEQVISFGDADPDAPMLEWTGLGIAMNHATEVAKAAANVVSPPSDPATNFACAVESIFVQTGL